MITQFEVPSILKGELPRLTGYDYPTWFSMDIYKSVQKKVNLEANLSYARSR